MDIKRLFKLFATLWWLIGIVAIAGAATAFFVANWRNSQIEEAWEATSPVLILKTNDESEADYEGRLRLAENRARLAVESSLSDNLHGYRVVANPDQGRLEFIATDSDSVTAQDLAEGLRSSYLAAEPAGGIVEQLASNLNDLEIQILSLRNSRQSITAETPLDPGVASELALMESQLSALRQRAAALSVATRFPELGTAVDEEGLPLAPEVIAADLVATRDVLERLEGEYESLAAGNPQPVGEDLSESLELLVIDQQIRDLESEYIDTALTIEELKGGGSTSVLSNQTELRNTTAATTSPIRAGLFGLVLGTILAAGLVVGTDRMRRAVLGTESDLELPIVAMVDLSRPGNDDNGVWYPNATGRRRSDVQVLRAALDRLPPGPNTIGLSPLGSSDEAVQELAADLSTSVAASGNEVLLMDAVFDAPSLLPEYGDSGASLAQLVTPQSGRTRDDLKVAVSDRESVLPGMLSLRAGTLVGDPVDAVASRAFREVLDVVADFADTVVVTTPHWGYPEAEVLAQRLDYQLFVGRVGITTAADVQQAADEVRSRGIETIGLVLLDGRSVGMVVLGAPGPLGISLSGRSRGRRRSQSPNLGGHGGLVESAQESTQGLLQETPLVDPESDPLRDRAAVIGDSELPTTDRADAPPDGPKSKAVAAAIVPEVRMDSPVEASDRRDETAAAAVAKVPAPTQERARPKQQEEAPEAGDVYLLSRLRYLASHGVSRPAIAGHPPGSLLMIPDQFSDGAASLLRADVFAEGSGRPRELEQSLRRVLSVEIEGAPNTDLAAGLDRWIHRRLLAVQAENLEKPVVYHLSSQLGTFQALVDAPSVDAATLAMLASSVRELGDRLRHQAMLEGLRGNFWREKRRKNERTSNLRAQIDDVEKFGLALQSLVETDEGTVLTREQLDSADILAPGHWVGH